MRTKPEVQQASEVAYLVREKGAKLEEYKTLKILRYEMVSGKPSLKVYRGKSAKPVANYYYSSVERLEESVRQYKEGEDRAEKWKAQRKAERAEARASVSNENVELGTIYHGSWGYDQTNNSYYQVVGKFGKKGLVVQEIGHSVEQTGMMSGESVPAANCFKGEPFRRLLTTGDGFSVDSVVSVRRWNGEPHYDSWYA